MNRFLRLEFTVVALLLASHGAAGCDSSNASDDVIPEEGDGAADAGGDAAKKDAAGDSAGGGGGGQKDAGTDSAAGGAAGQKDSGADSADEGAAGQKDAAADAVVVGSTFTISSWNTLYTNSISNIKTGTAAIAKKAQIIAFQELYYASRRTAIRDTFLCATCEYAGYITDYGSSGWASSGNVSTIWDKKRFKHIKSGSVQVL